MGNQANQQRNFSQIQPFRDVWGSQRRIFAAIVLKFSGNMDITLVIHHIKFGSDPSSVTMGNQANKQQF